MIQSRLIFFLLLSKRRKRVHFSRFWGNSYHWEDKREKTNIYVDITNKNWSIGMDWLVPGNGLSHHFNYVHAITLYYVHPLNDQICSKPNGMLNIHLVTVILISRRNNNTSMRYLTHYTLVVMFVSASSWRVHAHIEPLVPTHLPTMSEATLLPARTKKSHPSFNIPPYSLVWCSAIAFFLLIFDFYFLGVKHKCDHIILTICHVTHAISNL